MMAGMEKRSDDQFVIQTDMAPSVLKGEEVTLEARVRSIPKSDIHDQLSFEVTLEGQVLNAICDLEAIGNSGWEHAQALIVQSLIRITGRIQPTATNAEVDGSGNLANGTGNDGFQPNGHESSPSAPAYSIRVTSLTVLSKAARDLPSLKGGELSGSLQQRLNNRILDQRAAASGAMFKLYSGMTQLMVEFFIAHDFIWIQTPRLRGSHVAGDDEYFHVPYFGRDAWLCQHTQHALQGAIAMDMKRVFDIGPVFRAESESSSSARHMSEFTLLGANMVYENDWHEVLDMLGSMLVFVIRALQERKQYAALLETVRRYYPSSRPFRIGLDEQGRVPRITFMEAKRILREELGFHTDDQENFTPEEEAALGRHFRESPQLGKTDLFTIEHFPLAMRQFNSKTVQGAAELSETWDFIAGGREICSGSHRVSDYDELCRAMRSGATGPPMDPESEQWRGWTTAFKTGMPPHAGASFGVNRILQGFLGLEEIREVTLFPRDASRLAP